MSTSNKKSLFLAAAALPILVSTAVAQESTDTSTPVVETEEGVRKLDTITVQARLREESIQDVPVVVQAFDAELLDSFKATQFNDLNDLVSGLTIYSDGPVQPSINLRGIQGNAINPSSDDSVAINFDGVQHSNAQLFRFGLFDMEAVEVLKGPQALFFGKNSPGGIVALRTKNPTDEFYTEFQAGYEFAGERAYGHGIISGPLSENWGARVGVRYADQEGYFNNIWGDGDPTATQPLNQTGPDFEELMFLGTLQGEFDRGDITLKVISGNREGGQYSQSQLIVCNDLISAVNPFSDCTLDDNFATESFVIADGFETRFAPNEPFNETSLTQVSLSGSLNLTENWTLQSITGLVDIENTQVGAVGGAGNSPAFSIGVAARNSVETLSQEFRLDGDFDRLNVLMGAFVDDRKIEQGGSVYIAPFFPITPDTVVGVDGDSWSVFAQAEYDISDALTISVGGRYTEEDRSTTGENLTALPALGIAAGPHQLDPDSLSETNFSPEVSVTWRANDDVSFFANYKEGFKSGGFNTSITGRDSTAAGSAGAGNGVPIDDSYLREDVEGFEIGFKTEWFDNSLRLNGALFSYDYTELQQSTFITDENNVTRTATTNAGEAQVQGIEVDMLWLPPVEGLTVTGNLAYNDNEFGDYIAVCNEYQLWVDPTGCNVDFDNDVTTWAGSNNPNNLVAGTGFDAQDRSGHPLRRAPEWAGSLGFTHDAGLTNSLRLKTTGLLSYSGEYNANGENNPNGIQDAYVTLNGSLGLYSENDAWSIDLIGRNLTDEAYLTSAFDATRTTVGTATTFENMAAIRNAPRQVFLQLTVRPQAFGK